MIEEFVEPLAMKWQSNGWGATAGVVGQTVYHLLFAGNVTLFENDARRLRVMQHELTIAIKTRKWAWKPESLQALGIIDSDEQVSFKVDGKWYRPEKVTELTCLGTKLDAKATTEASILHRRSIAESTVWGLGKVLFKKADTGAKLQAWNLLVIGQALHDCRTWDLNRETCTN